LSRSLPFIFAVLLLASCDQDAQPNGNADSTANVVATKQPANRCAPPILAMVDGVQPIGQGSALLDETKANFATAYESACAKQWLNDKPLIDPQATDQKQLFLVNAPEANVASIYLSNVDGRRMVLEYPFLTTDGKSQVPTADELEEAIYCAVRGATPEEQEASGRCLVD
jgi:hypothetical protein